MALIHRKRLDASLREDNKDFLDNIRKDTKLNKSTICDLAFDCLRKELENGDIFSLLKAVSDSE